MTTKQLLDTPVSVYPDAMIPKKSMDVRSPAVDEFVKRNGIYMDIDAITSVMKK